MTGPVLRVLAIALAVTMLAGLVGATFAAPASPASGTPPAPRPGTVTAASAGPGTGGVPLLSGTEGWVNVTTHPLANAPYPRMYASEIYDPQFGGIVLFGGINNASRTFTQPAFNDTWLFANGTWENLTGRFATAPPARWAASFAWDAADGYALLFGGSTGGNGTTSGMFLNDTWGLNTTGWFPIPATSAPAARGFAPMVYDPNITATLLFSGGNIDFANGSIQADHDTWTYAAGVWTNITATAGSGAGQASTMAYDPATGGVVATGIMKPDSICAPLNQTWVFESNGTWNRVLNDSSPPPGGNLVYDAALGELLYVGGCLQANHAPLILTWEYANGSWTNVTSVLTSAAAPLCCSAVAFDPVQKVDLLFGGNRILPSVRQGYVSWAYSFPVAPLTAGIHAARLQGAAPFTANLTSVRTGGAGPFSFAWSFGDGSANGTSQNVTHVYTTPGTYTVEYRVTDSAGRSYNASLSLLVAPTLTVAASALPAAGEAPFRVTFNATASGGFAPYQYAWNFSDGTTVTGANGTHVYAAGGVYVTRLNVTDSSGDATEYNTTITVASPVSAGVVRTPTVGAAPLTVTFTATAAGGQGPYTYAWSFGDGTNGTGATPSHTYTVPGVYTAVLNLTDSFGRSDFVPTTITVVAPLTAAAAAGPSVGVGPLTVGFTSNPHGGLAPYTYSWGFGDGSVGTGASPSHTYAQPGNYTATLTVGDALNESVVSTTTVRVVAPLNVTAPGSPIVRAAPTAVTFAPAVHGGAAPYGFSWEFGDGALGLGSPITHTYATAGTYHANVTVTDALGESVTVTTVVVVVTPLGATVAADVSSVAVGASVTFTAATSGGYAPFSYAWSGLPPGCSGASGPSVACTPNATGTYTVVVTVSDSFETVNASTVVTVTSAPTTPGGSGPGSLSSAEIGFLAAIVVVAAVIAVLGYLLLRRPPAPKPLTPAPGAAAPPAPADDAEPVSGSADE